MDQWEVLTAKQVADLLWPTTMEPGWMEASLTCRRRSATQWLRRRDIAPAPGLRGDGREYVYPARAVLEAIATWPSRGGNRVSTKEERQRAARLGRERRRAANTPAGGTS